MAAARMQMQLQFPSSSPSLQKPATPPPPSAVSVANPNKIPIPLELKEKILCLEIMGVDAGKALSRNPSLRNATLASVNSVVDFLRHKANLRPDDLPKVIGMCPAILTSNVSRDLAPSLRFLTRDLNVPSDHRLRRALTKNPRLLASSASDQLRPALRYLRGLGFSDLSALAYRDSVLLVSSVENTLAPKLRFLESLGLSRDEAVGMVLRCPALFTFSVDNNFRPKFDYFAGVMERTVSELKDFPQYFAFSLEKRIKPRHLEAVQRGLQNHIPLPLMLKTTDQEFAHLLHNTRQ